MVATVVVAFLTPIPLHRFPCRRGALRSLELVQVLGDIFSAYARSRDGAIKSGGGGGGTAAASGGGGGEVPSFEHGGFLYSVLPFARPDEARSSCRTQGPVPLGPWAVVEVRVVFVPTHTRVRGCPRR